jgi:cation diffusion facilitator CzcD-associated flavoprotein CzcO
MPKDSEVIGSAAPAGEYDAIVIGAGFAGIRMLHEARKRGLSVRLLEKGSGPGGTWYWNRYPGARCDTPSWGYCFLHDEQLLQEWDWPEHFPGQGDIEAYFQHVIERFDMRKDMQFDTTVTSAVFDERANRWTVSTEAGETFGCTYLLSATGVLHVPIEPPFPGVKSFEGETYQTATWPAEDVDLVGKRVAVVGTGSSGVQVITTIAPCVTKLIVFQRTAPYVLPARNQPLDAFRREAIKSSYDYLKTLISKHPYALAYELADRLFTETPPERREGVFERGWELGDFRYVFFTFDDLLTNREANAMGAELVRKKIRAIVQDPETAEMLCPKDYPIFSKRPPVASGYYETYNRDNVVLVDVRENPIARITPRGIALEDGSEYEVDVIVYSLGFDAATGSMSRIDVRGRGGELLRDRWKQRPDSLYGLGVPGFPNMFMLSGPGAHLSNYPPAIEAQADWIGRAIDQMRDHGFATMEPTQEAADRWTAGLEEIAAATVMADGAKVGSWILGQNVPGKPKATYFYFGGASEYFKLITQEADAEFPGFTFTKAEATAAVG